MRRSASRQSRAAQRWRSLALAACLGASSGCTLLAGQPWGEAELALSAELEAPSSRLTDEGWIKSANDYAFDVTELDLGLTGMRLLSDAAPAAGTEATGEVFDPANPPPNYSLCHNGHCHHDDGRLVDYEDIQAELDGGGVAAGPATVVGQQVLNSPLRLWPEGEPVQLAACADGCRIDRISLSALAVGITELTFQAHVTDLRPPSTARLPPEGVTVAGGFDVAHLMDADLVERFDRDQPIGLRVSAAVLLSASVFDGIDVGAVVGTAWPAEEVFDLSDVTSVQEAVKDNVESDTSLLVEVARFEPDLSDNELALVPAPVEGR